ncbi:ABC transporter ATP-binding protein [Niameybacter massiliensis]|uniref:ABC transporter ATP-binding protein n=1 Tax=Niameybacter massiliensis TaxID=1658108 RepID=UPI0006B4C54D|nr:ABC transporter ATP-binding protein [Niameybacter massiliensis]
MIKVQNLSYQIGDKPILKDISLTFKPHTIYGIIGPNGAGKSTLLKHMMRIIEPSSSTVFLKDQDVTKVKVKEYAKQCSFVFQENPRDLDFTVEEMIAMGRYPYLDYMGHTTKADETVIERIIHELSLEKLRERSMLNLSGGEAQKVFIGRALAQETPILLLDEPISMLDVHNSVELLNRLKTIKDQHQLTIIMVIHDLNLAFQYCDEIVLLKEGEVLLAASRQEVLESEILQQVYHHRLKIIHDHGNTYVVPRANEKEA